LSRITEADPDISIRGNTFINVKGIMVTLTDPMKSLKLNLITFLIRHLIDMEVRNFTLHDVTYKHRLILAFSKNNESRN
jgi:hypothetical protein